MKLSIVFILLGVFQVKAGLYAQGAITLNMQQVEIEKVLAKIEKQGEFRFLYNYDLASLKKKVDANFQQSDIKDVLDQILVNTDLTFRLLENNLVVIISKDLQKQDIRITGRVIGSNGEPLSGVSVQVKGTSIGTVTNNNGEFTLTASETAILKISYIGYIDKEIEVKNQNVLNVQLSPSDKTLDQVVVVGYGTQRRKNLTGAVSTITSKDFEDRPVFSVVQAIQGKAAGVEVTQPSGKPGTDFSIRIRGTSSINSGNEPLYVIDGIQTTDTRGLDVNDIESIQILKDAASAAIYGVNGTNGVVLITTKRGKANRSNVAFNTYFGFSKLAKKISVLNTSQYRSLMDSILGVGTVPDSITTNTDWQNEVFKTGVTQSYQLSFSGGSDKTQYMLSLGYLKDKGMVEPARFDRYSARLNIDHKVNEWLKVSANMNYLRNITLNTGDNSSSGRGGVILSALNTPPSLNVYKNDGSGEFAPNPYQPSWENPLAYQSRQEKTVDNRLLANLNADARILKGLTYKLNLAGDISNSNYDFYVDPKRTVYGRQNNGVANIARNSNFTWLWENVLTYDKHFGSHNLNVLAGESVSQNNYDNTYVSTHDLYGTIQTTNAGNIIDNAGNTAKQWNLASFFGRILYDFDNKYLFTGAIRYDGSSKLAKGNQWETFPSFSVGWRISAEPFMRDMKTINDLKLRVGWGQTGNQQGIDNYTSYSLYNFNRISPTNPLSGPTVTQSSIANADLKWEKTTQTNIGLDLTFLNNRVTFTADAYVKKTDRLILNVPLPSSIGISSIIRNDGALENKGLEFAVSSRNTVGELKWNTNFNISFNRNKVTSLGLNKIYDFGNIYSNNQNVIRVVEGKPLGSFFGYISQGVDPQTGDIIYKDLNGSKTTTPDDRTFIGYAAPKFTYGLTNTFSYKNFDLNIFIQGVHGNDIFNATRIDLEGMFDSKNQSTNVLRRWTHAGQVTDIPRPINNGDLHNVNNSTRFIENGSYLRVKSATLAYNFSKALLNKKLQRLSIYVTGQNLLTITKYKGFDPEVNTFGTNSTGTEFGVDYGTYPQTRTIIFGLNVEF